jgi:hypothetical protein
VTDPLITARLVSIALFVMGVVVLERFMASTEVPPPVALLGLFFFVLSPLNLFYFRAPMVDDLALPFAFLSLYAFVVWDSKGGRGAYLTMIAAGIVSTLVKNPVYLPIPIAIAAYRLRQGGIRSLLRPSLATYFVLMGATVVGFKLYSNHLNAVSSFLTQRETDEYFGLLHDRLRLKFWKPIVITVVTRGLGPVGAALSLLGLVAYAFRAREPFRSLYLGLGLGTAVTLFIFFDKYNAHSYYCLPLVFPLAYFAAEGTHSLIRASSRLRYAPSLLLVAVLATSIVSARAGLAAMSLPSTAEIARDGEWVRLQTHPDDFVFYVVEDETSNWLPALLYFAKRDGYNLPYGRVGRRSLARLKGRFSVSGSDRPFVLFCPDPMREWLQDRLRSVGTPVAEAEGVGALYALPPLPPPGDPALSDRSPKEPDPPQPRPHPPLSSSQQAE